MVASVKSPAARAGRSAFTLIELLKVMIAPADGSVLGSDW
jgi:hypothetical protein